MTTGKTIRKAAVIGAGIMGAGIAAQLANAEIDVYLLDIVPAGAEDRSVIAKSAIQRMLKANPASDPLNAGFMSPANSRRVTPGNIEDDLEAAVREADWIVEVVIEDLPTKKALYTKLDTLRKPNAIVSSNTSTIPLKDLIEGRSSEFKRHFAVTHFFNPPRFMHLLELVGGEETDPAVLETLRNLGDVCLGKNVILCKDTPAFIANRIGIYFMFRTIVEALEQQVPIDAVDAVLGKPMGYPKEGVFGLLDLVGIGIMPHITQSLLQTLPQSDAFREMDHEPGLNLVNTLIQDGRTGRKSPKGGFYRMEKRPDGSKQKQVLNLKTNTYDDVGKPRIKGFKEAKTLGPRAILEVDETINRFAWAVMRDTLLYAASLIPEIADDIADVDAAMRDGYNAKWGPFELIDQLGVAWFSHRVVADGKPLPETLKLAGDRSFYREEEGERQRLVFDWQNNRAGYAPLPVKEGVLSLSAIKRKSKPLLTHYSASLWDIGDGVTCFEFHSKMNTLDSSVLWVLNQAISFITKSEQYHAMVIYNEAKNFSLGANLGVLDAGFGAANQPWAKAMGLSGLINHSLFGVVDTLVVHGQSVFKAMRDAPFPVIGAPQGMALGGGCEILLHCDALQAGAEAYMGLVESGVGVIPAWGGCTRYLAHCLENTRLKSGPIPPVRAAFEAILMPQNAVSSSAQDGREKLWLRKTDGITMNPERLLADAKARALAMVSGYTPPQSAQYKLPGRYGKTALCLAVDDFYIKGSATYHDVVVADALADVLTGNNSHIGIRLSESDLYHMEREGFYSLIKTTETRKRIAHMLKTGKPLREGPLESAQTLEAIRARRRVMPLPKQPLQSRPLDGTEACKLRLMAEVTAFLLKQFSG